MLEFCSSCKALMDPRVYQNWSFDGDLRWMRSLVDFVPAVMTESHPEKLRNQLIGTWFDDLKSELMHPRLAQAHRRQLEHYPHWIYDAYIALGGTLILEVLWSDRMGGVIESRLRGRRLAIVDGIEQISKSMKLKAMRNLKTIIESRLKEHKGVVDWILGLGDLGKLSDEDAGFVDAEMTFLDDRRESAVALLAAYQYLGEPGIIVKLANTILGSDNKVRKAEARLVPNPAFKRRDLDSWIPQLPWLRVMEAPEAYPWKWAWLTWKTGKSVPKIIGTKPFDVLPRVTSLRSGVAP